MAFNPSTAKLFDPKSAKPVKATAFDPGTARLFNPASATLLEEPDVEEESSSFGLKDSFDGSNIPASPGRMMAGDPEVEGTTGALSNYVAPDKGDSVLSAMGKSLANVPQQFKASIGGIIRDLGERSEEQGMADYLAGQGMSFSVEDVPGVRREAEAAGQSVSDYISKADEARADNPIARYGQEVANEALEEIKATSPEIVPDTLPYHAALTIGAVAQMAPAVITGILTKRPDLGLALMGTQVYGNVYAEERAAGESQDKAASKGFIYALSETVTEKIPLGILTKEGGSALARIAKSIGAEGIQEPVNEAIQIAYDVGFDPEATFSEALKSPEVKQRLFDAFIIGSAAGGALAVGSVGADNVINGSAEKQLGREMQRIVDNSEAVIPDDAGAQLLDPSRAQLEVIASGVEEIEAADTVEDAIEVASSQLDEEFNQEADDLPLDVAEEPETIPLQEESVDLTPYVDELIELNDKDPQSAANRFDELADDGLTEGELSQVQDRFQKAVNPDLQVVPEVSDDVQVGLDETNVPSSDQTQDVKKEPEPYKSPLAEKLYPEAVALAEESEDITASRLQQEFRVSAGVAKEVFNRMASEGIVSEPVEEEVLEPEGDTFTREQIDEAGKEAATHPENDLPEPTEAQKDAGNYKKAHVTIQGLDIAIENPQGSVREGTDSDGTAWSIDMQNDYGYIKRTRGADDEGGTDPSSIEQLDVFIGPTPESDQVFVVNQYVDGKFDEHKAILGATSEEEAREIYQSNYAKDWDGLHSIVPMSVDKFKEFAYDPEQTSKELLESESNENFSRIVSGEGEDLVTLYHGTSEEGHEGIIASGKINKGRYYGGIDGVALSPNKETAEDYAGGGPVVEVQIPKSKLVIDPESADPNDYENITDALDNGLSVYATGDVYLQKSPVDGVLQDVTPTAVAEKINSKPWYRGQHGAGKGIETRLGLATFTDDRSVAEIYAKEPNNRNDLTVNPRVLEAAPKVKNPAVLNEEGDRFVDYTTIRGLVGPEAARDIFERNVDHLRKTDNYIDVEKEYGVQSPAELDEAGLERLYMDFYPIADDRIAQKAIQDAGYDSIIGTGLFRDSESRELRVFDEGLLGLKEDVSHGTSIEKGTIERAVALAEKAHEGQVDRGGADYILHAKRLMDQAETEDQKLVAILHDTVEDTDVTLESLSSEFPQRIVDAVDALTIREGETKEDAAKRARKNPLARAVKILDLTDNSDLSRIPEPDEVDLARTEEYKKRLDYLKNPERVNYTDYSSEEIEAVESDFKSTLGLFDIDSLYEVAEENQKIINDIGERVTSQVEGLEWTTPGVKLREKTEKKLAKKGTVTGLTDVIRGGYFTESPEDADLAVDALSKDFDVYDEGWFVTDAGYFDRKALVRFPDGSIGEIQFWHRDMFEVKEFGGGHDLYDQMSALPFNDPEIDVLNQKMRDLYGAVVDSLPSAWDGVLGRAGTEGNLEEKESSESGRALVNTSAAEAGTQEPSLSSQTAGPSETAGTPSNEKNFISPPTGEIVPQEAAESTQDPLDGIDLSAVIITREAALEGTDDVFEIEESADTLLRRSDKEINMMQKLAECLIA